MSIIAHYSKAWTEALRLRPPFYLDADALLWGTNEVKFYALSSPFPLYTYSDHLAPIELDEEIEKRSRFAIPCGTIIRVGYRPPVHQGHLNSIADAGSRYPLLGSKRLAPC
jgi:hypothetical protein